MHTRQSPTSSRNRSTTTVRSSGTAPVAAAWSARYARRLRAARSSNPAPSMSRRSAASGWAARSSRVSRPNARPSSGGRESESPCQKAILPGCPGAGTTRTCDGVISTIFQLEAPSTNVSPGRLSNTISSSSSPTRRPSSKMLTV